MLVVDDEPEIRTFVRLALEDEGYAVRGASNGAEAAEDGQAPRGAAPIIVLTASRMPMDEVEALGVQGVLRKPFEVAELLETIARHASDAPALHPPGPGDPAVQRRHATCVPTDGEKESGGAGAAN